MESTGRRPKQNVLLKSNELGPLYLGVRGLMPLATNPYPDQGHSSGDCQIPRASQH